MPRTHCSHCKALLTPGAPFCLACFLPLEDEAPAAQAEAPAQSPAEAPAAAVPAAVGAAPADGFFAPPPPYQHPGEHVDWRASAPTAALLAPGARPARSRTPLVAGCVALTLLLVGVVFGGRALLSGPSEQEEFAVAFREARPPDFLPSMPDLGLYGTTGDGDVEGSGDAAAYVESIDSRVRAGSDALLGMQRTLADWADGDVTDDRLRTEIAALTKLLDETASTDMVGDAPPSTRRGLAKLAESVVEYRMALGSLLDWLDSRSGGARLTYRLSVGSANLHWDEGLINLYRAAGLPAPPLPHPPPKKR